MLSFPFNETLTAHVCRGHSAPGQMLAKVYHTFIELHKHTSFYFPLFVESTWKLCMAKLASNMTRSKSSLGYNLRHENVWVCDKLNTMSLSKL